MRSNLFLILVFYSFSGFSQEYFEGGITFKTDITVSDKAEADLLQKMKYKYGDSLKMYYSKAGDFKRKYINSGDSGNEYQTFLTKKKTLFVKTKNKNFVIPIDVSNNSLTFVKKTKLPQENILNLNCDCVQYEAKTPEDKTVFVVYCYTKLSETINYVAMENYSDFFLNDFFISTQRPYLKFSLIADDYTLTFIAMSMESTELDKNIWKIDDLQKKTTVERSKFF